MHKLTYKKKVSLSLITGAKIAKGERRGKRKTKFFKLGYAEPRPIFHKDKDGTSFLTPAMPTKNPLHDLWKGLY